MQLIVSYSPGIYVSLHARTREAVRTLYELCRKENKLQTWVATSDYHATWFAGDPIGAIRAAQLGLCEKALEKLESRTVKIAHPQRTA
ncbi:MAG: hypothetical protein LAP21_22095 [Acidobacteriia bacterium]|nr:hypothetical protein [Terriglobia bacterium]